MCARFVDTSFILPLSTSLRLRSLPLDSHHSEVLQSVSQPATWRRARRLSALFVSFGMDLGFLAGVAVLNWGASEFIFSQFETSGSASLVFASLEWLFAAATVLPAAGFVVADIATAGRAAIEQITDQSALAPTPQSQTDQVTLSAGEGDLVDLTTEYVVAPEEIPETP